MITGIGIDIVEIERIATLVNKHPKFVNRILTKREQHIYERLSDKRQIEFLAGRFAAKEAFSKAVGTGIGKELSFLDIEIVTDQVGRPLIIQPVTEGVFLSISHSREYAVAQVVIEQS